MFSKSLPPSEYVVSNPFVEDLSCPTFSVQGYRSASSRCVGGAKSGIPGSSRAVQKAGGSTPIVWSAKMNYYASTKRE